MKRVDIGRKVERSFSLNEARVIEENGGFALVLELVDPSGVAEITQSGFIPSFPHSCKPELRQKAAIMGSGSGEVWSGLVLYSSGSGILI